MKDLIAKLQMDASCALGAIWMHIDTQAKRIAELEAQIAAASAPVVEQQPVARLTFRDLTDDPFDIVIFDKSRCIDGMNLYAASTALQAPVREVPGYKLVPIEPTPEMQECMDKGSAYNTWKNMLAAAPLPAAPVQQEGE